MARVLRCFLAKLALHWHIARICALPVGGLMAGPALHWHIERTCYTPVVVPVPGQAGAALDNATAAVHCFLARLALH